MEIKWAHHPAGDTRKEWARTESGTTITMLVSGRFRVCLADSEREEVVTLEHQGDYAMWGPGVDHLWSAERESVVLTVRWPSTPERGVELVHGRQKGDPDIRR